MEDEKPSDDVIVEDQDVNEVEETSPVSSEQEGESPETIQEEQPKQQTVEERPQQNIDSEWKRKFENVVENLPKIVEEAVTKGRQPQEPEYTVEQLEEFALNNPEHRAWAEARKFDILKKEVGREYDERDARKEEARRAQIAAQNAEAEVLNDKRYESAFMVDNSGMKVINHQSPLAQRIGFYMNDHRVSSQPDAILVAAKLARADLLDETLPQQTSKLTSLKRQNTKLKQQTLAEGTGMVQNAPKKDAFDQAKERAARSGTLKDTQVAVQMFLKKTGRLK